MSLAAYFVSDLHLVNGDDERAKTFLTFLRRLGDEGKCTHLFLLGDIFDLWISDYQYFQDRFREIIDQIKRLQLEGVAIHYFEGNHDLYLQKFWQKKLGIQVHREPLVASLGPWKLRLEHGDQMDPSDTGYIFLRWFLRTPMMKFISQSLPQGILVKIGERASHSSRAYTSGYKSQDENTAKEKILAHGRRVFSQESFDVLIAGHLHVREDREVKVGESGFRLVNLGSWMDQPRAFLLTEKEGQWLDLQ